MKKCIMLFAAHADDVELQAAGTLFRALDKGYEAVYVMVTDNSSGLLNKNGELRFEGPRETQAIRHQETREAAAMFGLEPIFLRFKQRHFYDPATETRVVLGSREYQELSLDDSREPILSAGTIPECVQDVADLIASHEPEFVLTQTLDIDPEHRAVCNLLYLAFQQAAEKVKLGSLYAWGPSSGGEIIPVVPDTFVDITDYIDRKMEAFLKHASQITEKRRQAIMERGGQWGKELGVPYAEGFRTLVPGPTKLSDLNL